MTGRPFSGYLSVLDGTRTDNILRTRLPMEYQSFRGCDTFSRIRDSDVKGAFTGRGTSNDEIYRFGVHDKIEAWG